MKMKHIIIGIRGQIGTCVHTFLNGVGEGDVVGVEYGDVVVEGRHECNGYGNDDGLVERERYDYDVMHVCIPFYSRGDFITDVSYYMKKYRSRRVIVYSSVLPLTCEALGENVCHSPVEGRHPKLIDGFRTFKRFVSGREAEVVGGWFRGWGLEVETFRECVVTELGKLLSTTRYGINILFAAEQDKLCGEYEVRYEDVVTAYQRMYNEGYKKLNEERFVQPLTVPPRGRIGGHCVVPNAKLLTEVTDSEWIKKLSEWNNNYEI